MNPKAPIPITGSDVCLESGWFFPPKFTSKGQNVAMAFDKEDIYQSLSILLATRPGEHPIYPDFGCSLDVCVFEQLDQSLINSITYMITQAIKKYEQRIEIDAINTSVDEVKGMLIVEILFTIRCTGKRGAYQHSVELMP